MVRMKGLVGREMVSIRRGEWVSLVGWLEDGKDAVTKVGCSLSPLRRDRSEAKKKSRAYL